MSQPMMAHVTLAPAWVCAVTDSLSGSEQGVLMYSGCAGRGELKHHRAGRLSHCVCWGQAGCVGWCVGVKEMVCVGCCVGGVCGRCVRDGVYGMACKGWSLRDGV